MNVFISYPSEEVALAEELNLALLAEGYKVFFDRSNLPAGEGYNQYIRDAIKKSDLLVFMVTERSVAEGSYTLSELVMAQEKWPNPSGKILPVMLQPVELNKIPAYLRAVSLLKPQGNKVADTLSAIEKLKPASKSKNFIAIGVASALLLAVAIGLFNILQPTSNLSIEELNSPKGKFWKPEVTDLEVKFAYANTSSQSTFLTDIYLINDTQKRLEISPRQWGDIPLEYPGKKTTLGQLTISDVNKAFLINAWQLCFEIVGDDVQTLCSESTLLPPAETQAQTWVELTVAGDHLAFLDDEVLLTNNNRLYKFSDGAMSEPLDFSAYQIKDLLIGQEQAIVTLGMPGNLAFVDIEKMAISANIAIPANGESISSSQTIVPEQPPVQMEIIEDTILVTVEDKDIPMLFNRVSEIWNTPDWKYDYYGLDSDEWNMTSTDGLVWAVLTNSLPSSLFIVELDKNNVIRLGGHDFESVACANDVASTATGEALILSCENTVLSVDRSGNFRSIASLSPDSHQDLNTRFYYDIQFIERSGDKLLVAQTWRRTFQADMDNANFSKVDLIDLSTGNVDAIIPITSELDIRAVSFSTNMLAISVAENEDSVSTKTFLKTF